MRMNNGTIHKAMRFWISQRSYQFHEAPQACMQVDKSTWRRLGTKSGLTDWFCRAITLAVHTGLSIAIATHVDMKERVRSSKKNTINDKRMIWSLDQVDIE